MLHTLRSTPQLSTTTTTTTTTVSQMRNMSAGSQRLHYSSRVDSYTRLQRGGGRRQFHLAPASFPRESCSSRKVMCRVTSIRVSERLASTVPYLLPLFDGLRYGRFFFQQFPISLLIVEPLAPLIKVYFSLPFASLIAFFSLYYGVVQNTKFSRYVRYNTMQSILLDIGLILPSILEQVFKMPKGGPMLQLYVTVYNTVWIFLFVSVIYSVGCCLTGQKAKIPFVGEGADAQVDRRS